MVVDRLAPPALPDREPGSSKFRIRFKKDGDLRFVSHHDLLHCFERLLRRSGLPFLSTQGFNPHPRIVFALSLALGVAGQREVVEIEFAEGVTADEVRAGLAPHAPAGLTILEVRPVSRKTRGQAFRARYRVQLDVPDLHDRVAAFLAAATAFVERQRPIRKRLNVRPYVHELNVHGSCLEMDLWITPNGAARPEEILRSLGLEALVNTGLLIERSELELIDETDDSARFQWDGLRPTAAADSDTEHSTEESTAESEPTRRQPTPLLSGPLSFDS